jgi:hypothetical protein
MTSRFRRTRRGGGSSANGVRRYWQGVQAGFLHLMDEGCPPKARRLDYRSNGFENDESKEADKLIALAKSVAKAAANSLQPPSECMPRRQLDGRSPTFVVDGMHKGAVFWPHVDRFHRNAPMLEDPFCAQ